MNDPIGEIPIVITGDFSDLNDSIQQAQQVAQSGGAAIASSFSGATSRIMDLGEAARVFTEQGLEFDQTVKITTADLLKFSDSGQTALSSTQALDDAIKKASGDMGQQAQSAKDAGSAAQGYGASAGSLITTLAGFAGVTLSIQGLKAGVEEAFTAFAQLQRATESLTALTGSAKLADEAIAQMRTLAQDEALSFPSLLKADQQMAAFGISTKQSAALLAVAGDAAVATGRGFDSVSSSVQRIVESGAAMGRTLQGIGLTTSDLGRVMGVTAGEASKLFKSLDESTRVDIITTALSKFKGLAEDTSTDLTGSWQRLSNAAREEFANIGKELEGAGREFTSFATGAISALGSVAKFFIDFGKGISSTAGDITNALKNAAADWGISFEDYGAGAKKADEANKNLEKSTGTLTIAAHQLFAGFPDYNAKLSALVKEFQNGITDSTTFTSKVLVLEGQFKSLHPAIGAAADKSALYTAEVAKLKKQMDDGDITHAMYLQKLRDLEIQHGLVTKAAKDHVLSLADLTAKENTLTADVQKALGVWVSARTIWESTGDGVAVLNAAYAQLTKALKAAKEGFEDLNQTIIFSSKTQSEAFSQWQKGYSDALAAAVKDQDATAKSVQALAVDFNTLANNLNTYATNTTAYAEAYNTIQIVLKKLEDGLDKAGMSADDLDVKLVRVGNTGIPVITGGVTKVQDAFGKLDPVIRDVDTRIAALGQTTTGTVTVMQGGTTKLVTLWNDVKKAVDDVKTDVEDLGASIPTMAGKFKEGLFTVTDGLSKVTDSTHGVQDEFKITTEKGTVEWGNVSTAVDAVSTAASKATSNIIIMKGGILDATKNHKDLNDTASQLPTILNADATTMERVNSLIVQAGEATQKWATFTEQVAAAAKSAADSFAAFEQAAEDRMSGNARGGTVIPGATFKPGGITQATGSAGAELGSGLVPVNAPDALGTIGGGSPPPGMKWNANRTGFIPDIVWVDGVPYPAGSEPKGTSTGTSTPTSTVLDSGMVQALNSRIRAMFEDMVNAGTVDVAQLNSLAATIGEFVTVDAQGLHISWQQAAQAITTTTTATNDLGSSADKAGGIIAGFGRDTAAAAITLIPLPEKFASLGVAIADVTDAMKAEYQTRLTLTEQMNQKIDQLNAAGDASLAAAWASNPNQRFGSKSPIPHLLPPTMPTNPSNQQIFGNGIPFLRDDTGGGGTTITINNPIVRGPGDVDALVQQLRNLGV